MRAYLDSIATFTVPLRLRLACALSIWICLMLTLVALNLSNWIVQSIELAGQVSATLREQAEHSDQLQTATPLSASALQLLLLIGRTDLGQNEGTRTIVSKIARGLLQSGTCLTFAITLLNWVVIFRSAKVHILRLRRGDYFTERVGRFLGVDLAFDESGANRYIGYQVSHMMGLSCASHCIACLLVIATVVAMYSRASS